MLSVLGRQVVRNARPATTLSNGQRRGYTLPIDLLEDLSYRGFVHHVTRPTVLQEALESKRQVVYAGIDPTAQSLHIGHLIPLMCLLHFQLRGHKIIPLIGGATGRLGDPSGRHLERQPADIKQVEDNAAQLTQSIQNFFRRAFIYADTRIARNEELCVQPIVTNNLRWHERMNMLDFLQHVGIHARVNTMLNRESVRARLSSQQGLSFTEFTYQLLQAYDFYHLNKYFGCSIQIGGSDQWGNILAGLELIGRSDGTPSEHEHSSSAPEAFGITTPLLTTASGEKFGKSAGNAIWLDSNLTSVFDFYQYFIKVDDADIEKHLKLFTLLSWADISTVMAAHNEQPEKRIAQRRLAAEVTELVHAGTGCTRAQTLTHLLFETDYSSLTATEILTTFENDPRLVMVEEEELLELPIMKLAAKYRLVSSGSAARTLVRSRGLYINNRTVSDLQFKATKSDLIDDRVAILRAGKDKLLIIVANSLPI